MMFGRGMFLWAQLLVEPPTALSTITAFIKLLLRIHELISQRKCSSGLESIPVANWKADLLTKALVMIVLKVLYPKQGSILQNSVYFLSQAVSQWGFLFPTLQM